MIKLDVLGRGYIYLLCTVCGYNVVADRIFTRLIVIQKLLKETLARPKHKQAHTSTPTPTNGN